jgi:hypothetical protein
MGGASRSHLMPMADVARRKEMQKMVVKAARGVALFYTVYIVQGAGQEGSGLPGWAR